MAFFTAKNPLPRDDVDH